jgi:hypothetical protein
MADCLPHPNGQVKNFAENPFICNIAARVEAMRGSSSFSVNSKSASITLAFRVILQTAKHREGYVISMFLAPDHVTGQFCSPPDCSEIRWRRLESGGLLA